MKKRKKKKKEKEKECWVQNYANCSWCTRHKHHKTDPNKHVKVSKHKKHGIQSSIYVHQQNLT